MFNAAKSKPVPMPVKKTGSTRDQQKALAKLENQLAAVQDRLTELNGLLGEAALYEPAQKDDLARHLAEKQVLDAEMAVLEIKWLELSEATNS